MSGERLTAAQRFAAIALFERGFTLSQIAMTVGCSVLDLSPWIYAQEIRCRMLDAIPAVGGAER